MCGYGAYATVLLRIVSERPRSAEELDYERNGDATMMAHARSGSKPARMSHRAIPSSARRSSSPPRSGAILTASPFRRFAHSPSRLFRALDYLKKKPDERGRDGNPKTHSCSQPLVAPGLSFCG